MRLIDADSIKFTEYINGDITVSKDEIRNMPTAFDLDEVFQKITELQLSIKDKELSVEDEEYATMLRGRLRGIADVLEILKSATNATNGKNGG